MNPKTLGRSVNTARYRYTQWDNGKGGEELYDHQSDPREYRNLAGDAAHGTLLNEMKTVLQNGPDAALPSADVKAVSLKAADR